MTPETNFNGLPEVFKSPENRAEGTLPESAILDTLQEAKDTWILIDTAKTYRQYVNEGATNVDFIIDRIVTVTTEKFIDMYNLDYTKYSTLIKAQLAPFVDQIVNQISKEIEEIE